VKLARRELAARGVPLVGLVSGGRFVPAWMPGVRILRRRVRPPGVGAVNLQSARLSPAYRARLAHAYDVLTAWCAENGLPIKVLAENSEVANTCLIAFIQQLFELGGVLSVATDAVLSVQTYHRELKGRLRPAWDSIASWNLLAAVRSRVPLPLLLLEAFTRYGALAACSVDVCRAVAWWHFCVCLRLAFFGLLRPKELWGLKRGDLRIPGDRSLLVHEVVVITVREAKNRAFSGRLQIRAVRCPATVRWVRWMFAEASPSSRVWPFGPQLFRSLLDQAAAACGAAQVGLTAGSLRAGGATAMFDAGESISTIKFAGSWSSEKVLSHYLQSAAAAAALIDLSPQAVSTVQAVLGGLAFAGEPPPVPWRGLALSSPGMKLAAS